MSHTPKRIARLELFWNTDPKFALVIAKLNELVDAHNERLDAVEAAQKEPRTTVELRAATPPGTVADEV